MITQSALRVLEFDKIRQQLAQHAQTAGGRLHCLNLEPATEINVCQEKLSQTEDAFKILAEHGSLPLDGCEDIGDYLSLLAAGGVLGCRELLKFYRFLRSVDRVYHHLPAELLSAESELSKQQRFMREQDRLQKRQTSANYLLSQIDLLNPLSHLSERIDRSVASDDEIYDRATPELFSIRRSIAAAQEQIKQQLETILKRQADHLSDAVVTIRSDRYVVPVKSEHRKSVPGIIHDTSASGATVFIEPMAVVELNNKIRELKLSEEKEVYRICKLLSHALAEESGTLLRNQEVLFEIDFVQAKAILASELRGSVPRLNSTTTVLKRARHPLIDRAKVVPIDLEIGRDFTAIMITGPNTGGKTVSLKTCGLLVLMAQSGLMIPAAEGSQIRVFRQVLPDIGDEQSIEQNLSTFSAHLRALIKIIEVADRDSLVLLDEPGAGTDPAEGAALAMAIMDYLLQRDSQIIATTHYPELKNYALNRQGVINACCEFDTDTLRPTYKLLLGVPGVSNAFVISEKLGLPTDIIEAASQLLAGERRELESQLQALESSHRANRELEERIAELEKLAAERSGDLAANEKAALEREREIIRRAKQRAAHIIEEAQKETAEVITQLKEQAKSQNVNRSLPQARRLQHELAAKEAGLRREKRKTVLKPAEIKLGDKYQSYGGFSGTAVELPDSTGRVLLKAGAISMRIPVKELVPLKSEKGKSQGRYSVTTNKLTQQKHLTATTELKLIGLHVDEALYRMDSFLDDSVLTGTTKLRIVHGKGTGALRRAIHDKLKRDVRVASFQLASFGEGDSGVTLVELK